MILYIENLAGERQEYIINDYDDLNTLFEKFPQTREIALFSDSIEEAVHNMAEYLSGHHLNSWVDKDDRFSKNIKSALAGLGMVAAAAGLTPTAASSDQPIKHPSIQQEAAQFKPFGKQKEDAFLHNIMQLETGGGKNLDHPVIKHGKYKGQKAIGKWGLLHPTVDEVLHRMETVHKLHPLLKPLMAMNRDQIHDTFVKKPYLELEIARFLARHVLARNQNNYAKGAYCWNMGHNIFPHEISDDDLKSHGYTQDFMKLASGVGIRGLQPAKIFRTPAMRKSDSSFEERLMSWAKERENKKRNELTQWTRTARNTDKGSNRDSELDKKPAKNDVDKLQDAVKQANKKT